MIVGVLLAAGAGSRFGGGKLLAPAADGVPVGVRAARALRPAVDRAVAVVRPGDDVLAERLEAEGFDVAPFPGADEGMGASLAFGVSSAPGADGWLVALADMPFVRPATVASVAARLREGAFIVAPFLSGRRGHPVGFARPLFAELARLGGDGGARAVLARHASRVESLASDDPGVLHDVDVPEDLRGEPDGHRDKK